MRNGSCVDHALLPVAALAALACGTDPAPARAQWTVVVSTDAPVPQLGDRLLVDIEVDGQGCDGCRRELAAGDPGSWPISFGMVAHEPASSVVVTATLYRLLAVGADGAPVGRYRIERKATLPSARGVDRVSLELPMRCMGVLPAVGENATCEPNSGTLGPISELPRVSDAPALEVGSWPPAQLVDCPSPAPEGMVCVPGGTFLLGYPRLGPSDAIFLPEALVQVSPFALDVDELTVGRFREAVTAGAVTAPPETGPSTSLTGACTYRADGSNDALPVNCLDLAMAKAVCAHFGKRLPTEAEREWAAGNLNRETRYPWGDDADVCAHAHVARAQTFELFGDAVSSCFEPGDVYGPITSGNSKDVTDLGIRNLGGNVAEYVFDGLEPYDASCFSSGLPTLNPKCSPGLGPMARGGYWGSFAFRARAVVRDVPSAEYTAPFGVRCAR